MEKEFTLDDTYISLENSSQKLNFSTDDIMKKSIISDDFHSLKTLPYETKTRRKKKPKVRTEIPQEVKTDLAVLRMRSVLDTKRFYKRNATKGMKDIQVGVVLDSPTDFYHSRLPKKQRKSTLVDELLADAKFKKNIKERYVKIIEERKDKYKKKYKTYNKKKKVNKK